LKLGYLQGRLSTDTFEARVATAYETRSSRTLRALRADLRGWRAQLEHVLRDAREPAPAAQAPSLTLMLSRCGATCLIAGRSSSCDIVLASDAVSRRHAVVTLLDDGWHVADLGSTNGTYIDGARVDKAHVQLGQRLTLADTVIYIA
jgi:hypothetical protein